MTAQDIAEMVEFVEGHAIAEMAQAMAPEVAARYDVHLQWIGSAVALALRRVDVPMFNRVVGLGLREPVTNAILDAVVDLYHGARVRYLVQISPVALSSDLHAQLEARGLSREDNWVQLIRGPEPPPAIRTGLRIERIDADAAESLAAILCIGFELPREYAVFFTGLVGRPRWRHYLAYDGEMPIAAGVLYVQDHVGYLASAATLPSHRRRGAQGALMAQRIRDAMDLGCRYLVTETVEETTTYSNPSYHNMLRTGFRLAYPRPNYIYFPA